MRYRVFLLLVALACAVEAQTSPDWLFLRSGTKVQGTFEGGDPTTIRFRSGDGAVRQYSRQEIAWIMLGSNSGTSAALPPSTVATEAPAGSSSGIEKCMQGGMPGVPADTGSSIPADQAQRALQFHNCIRQEVGTAPLQWSPGLAARAQSWAEHLAKDEGCNLVHTQNNKYGENLFGGSGRNWAAIDASQDWYSEKKDFHYGPLNESTWQPAGHYSQMIWKGTRSVGMGQARCAGGGTVIVAEYDPPGNYMGESPY